MKKLTVTLIILSLLMTGIIFSVNKDQSKTIIAITSISDQQVEFQMASMSNQQDLQFKTLQTPIEISIDSVLAGTFLIEAVEQGAKLHVEADYPSGQLSGNGRHVVLNFKRKEGSIMCWMDEK